MKWHRIFHFNMLKGWNTPMTVCLAAEEMEDGEEIPLWGRSLRNRRSMNGKVPLNEDIQNSYFE